MSQDAAHAGHAEHAGHTEHAGHAGHDHDDVDPGALAELLDLDAEVLHVYLSDVTAWVREQAGNAPCHTIVDLGAGTGSGSVALARCFDGARVTAVDRSEDMLDRVRARAAQFGLADRIRTLQADLDVGWPDLPLVDLVWASNAMHEFADPGKFLGSVFDAIRPGGLVAIAEMESSPRLLPDDIGIGRPGLESRWRSVVQQAHVEAGMQLGRLNVGTLLTRAGFSLVATRTFVINLTSPPPATGRYAQAYLRQIQPLLADRLNADDLSSLHTLLDPAATGSILHRDDLVVRTSRTAWIAARP